MTKALNEINIALEYGVDVAGRRVFLHGDVEESTIGMAVRAMYVMADRSDKPIEVYVSSYGGSIDESFALHDVTRTVRCPVHTVALGKCMSAAPLLVACGHHGQRCAGPQTTFMLHDCSLISEGSPSQIRSHVDAARDAMERLAVLLASYTTKKKGHWSRIFNRKNDYFFNADQALDWGLIDFIWSEK